MRGLIEQLLHPLVIAGALGLWFAVDDIGVATIAAMLSAQVMLRVCEHLFPANPDWRQTGSELWAIAGITVMALVLYGIVQGLYSVWLSVPLNGLRETLGLDIWPTGWPMLAQVLLAFFASDLIYYWIHRGIHRWTWLWRLSGHGFHHAFANLHAINFQTTHPLENLLLVLPLVFLGLIFGAPVEATLGTTMLIVVTASFAHANFHSRAHWLGWLITNSNQHNRHHSNVFEESNTNFACNAIIWDRLFGTYSEGPVQQTGIGPTEPGTLAKFLLPFKEPANIQTAPRRSARLKSSGREPNDF